MINNAQTRSSTESNNQILGISDSTASIERLRNDASSGSAKQLITGNINSDSLDKLVTASENETELFVKREESFIFAEQTRILFRVIQNEQYTIGDVAPSEKYFEEIALEYSKSTLFKFIADLISQYYDRADVLSSISNYLSTVPINDAYFYNATTLLIALLAHTDSDVVENTLRIFENWNDKRVLNILTNVVIKKDWLDEYRVEIIKRIV